MSEFEIHRGVDSLDFLKFTDKKWDHVISDPPYDMNEEIKNAYLSLLSKVCDGNIVLFCSPENLWFHPDEWLFWIKPLSTKNFSRRCGRFVEMIAVYRSDTFNQLHWSQMVGVYEDRLIERELSHPYQKPLSLIERLVSIYTNPGDSVLDPFAGSGTVGQACLNLGRTCTGIELDE